MGRRGEPHETFVVGKYTVNIHHDEHADSPDQWGDEDRFVVAWSREFSVERRNWSNLSAFSEFVHPQYRENILDMIDQQLISGSDRPAAEPFDGPQDPLWVEDYIEGCTDKLETLLIAAGQSGGFEDQEGARLAYKRWALRRELWDAWAEFDKAHSEWAVFELNVQYYGGGCLRIYLGDPYDGDHTDARGCEHEPEGMVVIKREPGVDPQKAAEGLLEIWEQYLEGDVWYYEVLDENEDIVECCGGYYGLDDCIAEARSVAEHLVKQDNINTNKEAC